MPFSSICARHSNAGISVSMGGKNWQLKNDSYTHIAINFKLKAGKVLRDWRVLQHKNLFLVHRINLLKAHYVIYKDVIASKSIIHNAKPSCL
jgi:hypothetical protein